MFIKIKAPHYAPAEIGMVYPATGLYKKTRLPYCTRYTEVLEAYAIKIKDCLATHVIHVMPEHAQEMVKNPLYTGLSGQPKYIDAETRAIASAVASAYGVPGWAVVDSKDIKESFKKAMKIINETSNKKEKQYREVPFTWEKWESGNYTLKCRNGVIPKRLIWAPELGYDRCIISILPHCATRTHGSSGQVVQIDGFESDQDLLLFEEIKEQWVVVYRKRGHAGESIYPQIFNSEKEAREHSAILCENGCTDLGIKKLS